MSISLLFVYALTGCSFDESMLHAPAKMDAVSAAPLVHGSPDSSPADGQLALAEVFRETSLPGSVTGYGGRLLFLRTAVPTLRQKVRLSTAEAHRYLVGEQEPRGRKAQPRGRDLQPAGSGAGSSRGRTLG